MSFSGKVSAVLTMSELCFSVIHLSAQRPEWELPKRGTTASLLELHPQEDNKNNKDTFTCHIILGLYSRNLISVRASRQTRIIVSIAEMIYQNRNTEELEHCSDCV